MRTPQWQIAIYAFIVTHASFYFAYIIGMQEVLFDTASDWCPYVILTLGLVFVNLGQLRLLVMWDSWLGGKALSRDGMEEMAEKGAP
jgi:hypothetical protein